MSEATRAMAAVAVSVRRAGMSPERAAAVDVARALDALPAIIDADPDYQTALHHAREIGAGLDEMVSAADRCVAKYLG